MCGGGGLWATVSSPAEVLGAQCSWKLVTLKESWSNDHPLGLTSYKGFHEVAPLCGTRTRGRSWADFWLLRHILGPHVLSVLSG